MLYGYLNFLISNSVYSFFLFNQRIIESNYFKIRKSNVLNIFEKTKESTVFTKEPIKYQLS
jgi:hypothetical protein